MKANQTHLLKMFTKEDLKDRLGELDKYYGDANEEMTTELQ